MAWSDSQHTTASVAVVLLMRYQPRKPLHSHPGEHRNRRSQKFGHGDRPLSASKGTSDYRKYFSVCQYFSPTTAPHEVQAMNANRSYRRIFSEINEILWERVEASIDVDVLNTVGEFNAIDFKAARIERKAEDAKKVITAYIDQQTAMMCKLIRESRFSRFPMPRRRIRLWTLLRSRIELARATRAWRSSEWRASEQNQGQDDRAL